MNPFYIDKYEIHGDHISFQIKGPERFSAWVGVSIERLKEILGASSASAGEGTP
jgi:hypothetical protein